MRIRLLTHKQFDIKNCAMKSSLSWNCVFRFKLLRLCILLVLTSTLIDCEFVTNWQQYDRSQAFNSDSCSSAKSILDFLKNVEKKFILSTQTEFVLLLGSTGTGKTTIGLIDRQQ